MTSSKENLLFSLPILASRHREKKEELTKILDEGIHWAGLSEKEISLSVYYHLKKLSLLDSIPARINRKLENHFLSNTGYNILHLENLAQLIKRLKEKRIPVIILKGAALCDTVYPHVGIRAFCDLDILVPQKNLPEMIAVLKHLGYSISFTQARHHFTAFRRSNRSLPLEVHWDLVNPASPFQKYAFHLSLNKIWQDAVPLQIRGIEALWLSPEHQLIYLSIHMLKEGYANPKWLLDIYYLLKFFEGRMDWQKLLHECREFQANRPVYYALSTVERLFHSHETNGKWLNRNALDELKPQHISAMERSVFGRLLKNRPMKSSVYRFFLYFYSIERFGDKLKALLSLLKYSFQLAFLKFKENA